MFGRDNAASAAARSRVRPPENGRVVQSQGGSDCSHPSAPLDSSGGRIQLALHLFGHMRLLQRSHRSVKSDREECDRCVFRAGASAFRAS
jgi:hypothetical protein